MENETSLIVRKDLKFAIEMAERHCLVVPSWYWMLVSETEEQWISRRVKLSLENSCCKGVLLVNDVSFTYDIPLPFESTNKIDICIKNNKEENHFVTLYEGLYGTLTSLIERHKQRR
jgi:hypothetical protein